MVVERWWNGAWGRLVRRDIELARDRDSWSVSWWRGSDRADGGTRGDLDEVSARAWVDHLIRWAPGPRSDWRQLSQESRQARWD